jgi:ABC-type cobalamin/Fe3+-siderophores transport system ATPase subunit
MMAWMGWIGGADAKTKPIVCIVIGMAGSGKTTLLQVTFAVYPHSSHIIYDMMVND